MTDSKSYGGRESRAGRNPDAEWEAITAEIDSRQSDAAINAWSRHTPWLSTSSLDALDAAAVLTGRDTDTLLEMLIDDWLPAMVASKKVPK